MAVEKSEIGKLNGKDLIKTVIMTLLGTVMSSIVVLLNSGDQLTLESFKIALLGGLVTGVTYLTKNWLSNSEDKLLIKEVKK